MFFFFNDTATTEIYTLSLHDALPIYLPERAFDVENTEHTLQLTETAVISQRLVNETRFQYRSEEHTSELQSRQYLVCRLLLEKKKKKQVKPLMQNATQLLIRTFQTVL